jgi:hypothetical protein
MSPLRISVGLSDRRAPHCDTSAVRRHPRDVTDPTPAGFPT